MGRPLEPRRAVKQRRIRLRGWAQLPRLSHLVNWDGGDARVPRMPIREYLGRNRPIFGSETMEMRGWTRSRLGAFLSVGEYPKLTDCDMSPPISRFPTTRRPTASSSSR